MTGDDNTVVCCKTCGLAAVSVEQAFENPGGYYVYILWGDDPDIPLYVGQSTNVFARIGQHLGDPRKRALMKRLQLIRCDAEHVMNAAEARLIRSYGPVFNVQGVSPFDKDLAEIKRLKAERLKAERLKHAKIAKLKALAAKFEAERDAEVDAP
jgi:hypothetical protein